MSLNPSARMRKAQLEVMLAAFAFAAGVPANKLLLADVAPLALSGALYISAGTLCALLVYFRRSTASTRRKSQVLRPRRRPNFSLKTRSTSSPNS
jgi:hypothetical protein